MDSSDRQAASRLFSKWKQESAKVRILVMGPPFSLTLSGAVVEFDGDFFTVEGDDFSFTVDLDGATFSEESKLPKFPVCVNVVLNGAARLVPEPFGEMRCLICELP